MLYFKIFNDLILENVIILIERNKVQSILFIWIILYYSVLTLADKLFFKNIIFFPHSVYDKTKLLNPFYVGLLLIHTLFNKIKIFNTFLIDIFI